VSDDDFFVRQHHLRQKIDKHPIEGGLSRSLRTGNEVDAVGKKIVEH
jgi:hypothetical protein